jgi:hypothetical protein
MTSDGIARQKVGGGLQKHHTNMTNRKTKGEKDDVLKWHTTNKERKNIHYHCNDYEVVVLSCCTTDIKYSIHNN